MQKLAEALAAAQKEIGTANKTSDNPHFKSKYADLAEVWSAWQEVGPKNGLALIQTTRILEDGRQALITTLIHTSGEQMTGEMLLLPTKNDMQGIGAAMTYCRRYALAAMVGIVQDDDDGRIATRAPAAPKAAAEAKQTPEDKAIAWVARQKDIIKELPNKVLFTEWRVQNKKHLADLETKFPAIAEKFSEWLSGEYDNKQEAA